MIYALRSDVVPRSGSQLSPGNVRLREFKRPRPIVLRVNVGDCIRITFTNYLNPQRVDENQSATRYASVHAIGMELANSIADDGSYVGKNALNRLRQLRGYQHGHYHKQWGEKQDNEHLAQLQLRLPAEQDNYPELILHALQDSYDTFFSGGTQAQDRATVPPPLSSR